MNPFLCPPKHDDPYYYIRGQIEIDGRLENNVILAVFNPQWKEAETQAFELLKRLKGEA